MEARASFEVVGALPLRKSEKLGHSGWMDGWKCNPATSMISTLPKMLGDISPLNINPFMLLHFKNISEVLSCKCRKIILLSPFSISIIRVGSQFLNISKGITFASLMTQRLILLQRKSDKAPSFNNWIRKMLSMLQLEKLTPTWLTLNEYVKNLT